MAYKTSSKKTRVAKKSAEIVSSKPPKRTKSLKALKIELPEEKEVLDAVEDVDVEDVTEVLGSIEAVETVEVLDDGEKLPSRKSVIEDILFKLPHVDKPIIGTPKQVQDKLDKIALSIQRSPKALKSQKLFNKIHLYMHGYLINIVLRQFPYIKGMQTADIYQQTLIALWAKAIPNFKTDKGMSFLNFAKMCIRRHLITILNTSKTRQLDQAINQAISLDSYPLNSDEDSHNTFSNIIPDKNDAADKKMADEEAYEITRDALLSVLSEFERRVLNEYLSTSTYKEIATDIANANKKRCIPKSVDNALLRIRKKALYLRRYGKVEEIPLFIV